jgi:hypothetical protein
LVGSSSSSRSERHISARARFRRTRQPPENSPPAVSKSASVKAQAVQQFGGAGAARSRRSRRKTRVQVADGLAIMRLRRRAGRRSMRRSSASPSRTKSMAAVGQGRRFLADVGDAPAAAARGRRHRVQLAAQAARTGWTCRSRWRR